MLNVLNTDVQISKAKKNPEFLCLLVNILCLDASAIWQTTWLTMEAPEK